MKRFLIWALLLMGLTIAACAKKSENVAASSVSPLAYQQFNCRQLAEEAGRVSQRAAERCPSDRPASDLRSATPFNSLLPERQLATHPMVEAATRDELIIRAWRQHRSARS